MPARDGGGEKPVTRGNVEWADTCEDRKKMWYSLTPGWKKKIQTGVKGGGKKGGKNGYSLF